MPGATTFDRIIVAAVAVLIGAFTLGALGPLVTEASGDDVSGKRDDDGVEVALVDEEDDDADGDPLARDNSRSRGGDDSRGDNTGKSKASRNSGSRSIGSNSGNTRTGTTNGTGKSRSVSNSSGASKNTATGTTRGTGKSASVSNSS
jgi:hypothetical protein